MEVSTTTKKSCCLRPGKWKKYYALKNKALTSLFLFLALAYSSIISAQNFPPATSCTSKDLLLIGATLTGGDVCNSCTPGQTLSRTLTLSLDNKTGSTRTSFAFWGTLEIYNSDGSLASSTSITGCNGPVGANPNNLNFQNITYQCGQFLKITNLYLAWTEASPNATCPLDPSKIDPKCGTLPEIVINAGVNGLFSVTNVTCFGGNNGAINLSPSGGTAPYTFAWTASNGGVIPAGQADDEDLTGLVAGTYTVTITDNNGCSITKSTNVTAPEAPVPAADVTVTQPTCTVGTGTITVNSPTGAGLTYSINGVGGPFQSSPTFNNVTPGNYSVVVKNAAGCTSAPTPATVNAQPGTPDAADVTVTQPTCTVGTGTITVNSPTGAGLTYSINGVGGPFQSSPTFNNVTPGNYSVVVKNAAGCTSAPTPATVNAQPGTPDAADVTVTQPTCTVGTGTITVNSPTGAGLTYSINGVGGPFQSSPTFNNVTPGNYSVVVKNAAGCTSAPTPATVNAQPGTPDAADVTVTQPTCTVGTGTITVNSPTGAGLTYSINGVGGPFQSSPTFNNVTPGNYSVVVKNAAGCTSAPTPATVNAQPGTPDAADVTVTQPTCTVGTGTITVNSPTGAGLTYSINGVGGPFQSSPTFNNVTPGNYSVVVKNAAGCTSAPTPATVNAQPGTPDAADVTVTQPTCTVGTGTITVNSPTGAGLTYSINGVGGPFQSSPTFNNVTPGNYSVVVKNAAGCTSAPTPATVNAQPGTPDAADVTVTQPTCTVGTGTITVNSPTGAGLTYSINGVGGPFQSSPTFNNVTPGNYSVVVKNAAGCTSAPTPATVNAQPGTPDAADVTVTQPTCTVGTGTITVNSPTGAGLTYSINGVGGPFQSSPTFNNVTPGNYSVVVKNAAGCTSAPTPATVNAQPNLTKPTATASSPGCGQTSGSITITNYDASVTYTLLQGGNPTGITQSGGVFSNVSPGTYVIKATKGSCEINSNSITVNPAPVCDVFCTYTQGFYGNKNGLKLLPSLLTSPLTIGRSGHSVIIPANTSSVKSAAKLNSVMPGGSTPAVLKAGNCSIMDPCFSQYLTGQGRINNVLLSQTITLTLNTRLKNGALSSFPIKSGYLVTQGGCSKLNSSVVNYLTANGTKNATVTDLLNLANDVLGGTKTAGAGGVPSLSNINSVIDAINNIFDGCKNFIGYYSTCPYTTTITTSVQGLEEQPEVEKALKVSTYPNPFTDKVRFVIESSVSGQANLELYNMLGQKVQTVYHGHVTGGISQSIEYSVPTVSRGNLIYILNLNGKQVTGKLLNVKN